MLKRILITMWVGLVALPVFAAPGDDAVLSAQSAYAAKRATQLDAAARDVPSDHTLVPYVEFWQWMQALPRIDDGRTATLLATYPGSWIAERVRAEWLKDLGRREMWPAYLAEFPRLVKPETIHHCYAHRAEWAAGDRRRLAEAVALWFNGRDLPSACAPLFEQLFAAGYLQPEDRWRRLRLALEADNPNVAKALAASLPDDQRPTAASIDQARRDPARWLAAQRESGTRGQREVMLYALARLAKTDSAAAHLALNAALTQFSASEQQSAWATLATQAARRHETVALDWFARAGIVAVNDSQREWWVRSALRASDWPGVARVIASMSNALREQPVWRYWLARAHKAMGYMQAANQGFLTLVRDHHYYAQLAREELGPVMQATTINIKPSGADIEAMSRHPGLARAVALYQLGLRSDAAQEWNWSLRGLNDVQLLAAADIARRLDWYDRAIYAAEQTRDLHDFELRFIAPYRELASQAARDNALDEAWVFGLMRQESRFINVARSSVGASGLMQVMPATGRWIANRLGIKGFHPSDMQDPATNIRFGSYYLKQILGNLDGSPVLATAAYNAGPGRAQRWRDSQPMEGAVYIESIPFNETRDYVKKVMSNAMHYAVRFNQPSVLLKDRLGEIPARRAASVSTRDDPVIAESQPE
ncbi:MAG: transglycosylase SLT domain-containing protein [Thiobacillus sp.]